MDNDDGAKAPAGVDGEAASTRNDHDRPSWRDAPGLNATPLLVVGRYQRIGHTVDGLTLSVEDITVYRDGLLFRLKCTANDSHNFLSSHFSLGFRSKPPSFHHASVRLTLPNGLVPNSDNCNPQNAPKDPTSFWMACGVSFRSKQEAGAEYFVSPRPASGTLSIAVQYEHFGLNEETTVTVEVPETGS